MTTATYSPDDNKLRLYSDARLGAETYARAKAAGFKWAPKQNLFVAPAWTPEREDLLLDLCGEIGDEDTSLVDRAGERAERFDDYGDRRAADAEQAKAAVDALADGIPFGQPILVGHHSERHARKDAERIESGMRKAVQLWRTSQYWSDRAAGALRHAKYKERPDVRARRIKGLEADRRRYLREKESAETRLRLWDNGGQPLARDRALVVANCHSDGGVVLPNGETHWSAWSALEQELVTPEYVQERKRLSLPPVIEHYARWVEHADNRLAYERALLGESGGIPADATKPEKGGACRCWCSPGYGKGWSYIKKVNKVSVTVEDNWGNGGANFTRTIPFDKLTALMTKTDVDAARARGPESFAESAHGDGFFLADRAETRDESRRRVHEEATAANGKASEFEALAESLKAGVQVVAAPQLFPTPPDIARQVVELAGIEPAHRVLEPSAGTGALLRAVGPGPNKVAVEVNGDLVRLLISGGAGSGTSIVQADFLECLPEPADPDDETDGRPAFGRFDRIVMNPPFERGVDIRHVEHALTFLMPGGRLVSVVANGPRQRERLMPQATAWIDLPAGSFEEQGTNVNAAIVVIDR